MTDPRPLSRGRIKGDHKVARTFSGGVGAVCPPLALRTTTRVDPTESPFIAPLFLSVNNFHLIKEVFS
jgi:hypothetical protein